MLHRYWRARFPSGGQASGAVCCAELILRTTYGGGTNQALTGTASTGSTINTGFEPAKAIDGSNSTFWFGSPGTNAYLAVDLGSAKDIVEVALTNRPDGTNQSPLQILWDYSDDGTTYTNAYDTGALTWSSASQTQTWDFSPPPTAQLKTTQSDTLVALTIPATDTRNTEALTLTAINFPSVAERTTTVDTLIAGSPQGTLRTTEADVLVAILFGAEERMLRAWTFTQDGHDFYVLLAGGETYVYDKETETWCQWVSPDASFWRGVDGVDWEGLNVCIDPDSGKVFNIDPQGRLDYRTTPITSIVYGGMTERFREMPSCYFAEIAISQNSPPHNVDPTTLSITLETTDTLNSWNHGTVYGAPTGNMTVPRFYGLGLLHSPGVLFKITDTGFARRLDGLTVEISGTPNG